VLFVSQALESRLLNFPSKPSKEAAPVNRHLGSWYQQAPASEQIGAQLLGTPEKMRRLTSAAVKAGYGGKVIEPPPGWSGAQADQIGAMASKIRPTEHVPFHEETYQLRKFYFIYGHPGSDAWDSSRLLTIKEQGLEPILLLDYDSPQVKQEFSESAGSLAHDFAEADGQTGLKPHGSTRSALEALAQLPLPHLHVLDAGAGDASLSIYMAKAGAAGVVAVDFDHLRPQAEANILRNDVSDLIRWIDMPLMQLSMKETGPIDVMVMNMSQGELEASLPRLLLELIGLKTVVLAGDYKPYQSVEPGLYRRPYENVQGLLERLGFSMRAQHGVRDGDKTWVSQVWESRPPTSQAPTQFGTEKTYSDPAFEELHRLLVNTFRPDPRTWVLTFDNGQLVRPAGRTWTPEEERLLSKLERLVSPHLPPGNPPVHLYLFSGEQMAADGRFGKDVHALVTRDNGALYMAAGAGGFTPEGAPRAQASVYLTRELLRDSSSARLGVLFEEEVGHALQKARGGTRRRKMEGR